MSDYIVAYLTEQHMNQIFKNGTSAYLNIVFYTLLIAKIYSFKFGLSRQLQKKTQNSK